LPQTLEFYKNSERIYQFGGLKPSIFGRFHLLYTDMIDRRSFLKTSGLLGAAVGMAPVDGLALSHAPLSEAPRAANIVVSSGEAVADTASGQVRGYIDRGVFTFKGVPYAASPGLENRFKPPLPVAPWKGVRNSLAYGSVCPQRPNKGWASEEYAFLFQWNDGRQDEDCLRLNVWTPAMKPATKKPVMFWIHGGAYFSGSSQEHPSYDGRNLSESGDVVVVSVNHRLNIFGFLDLSEFDASGQYSANAGMLDLVAALQWVRDNIGNFGGDAGNVTIFGQSGGAAKVTTLMAMPAAMGLFHKAISQSTSTARVATPDYARELARHALAYLNISSGNLADIHRADVRTLVEASVQAETRMKGVPADMGRAGWQPVLDKSLPLMPFSPATLAANTHIPLLIGSNRNEWSASINNAPAEAMTAQELQKALEEKYPGMGAAFYDVCHRAYPSVKPVEILSYLNPYNPTAHELAEQKSKQGGQVFLYMFSWNTKVMDGRPRAYHCSEIPFVFHNTDRCDTMTGGTPEAKALSEKISKAWTTFARTGNPNHRGLPAWPAFTSRGETMILDVSPTVKYDPDRAFREYYRQL
jgi:para-nitrobenzyl esterase